MSLTCTKKGKKANVLGFCVCGEEQYEMRVGAGSQTQIMCDLL